MPRNKIIIICGAVIVLMPILGFPGSWEAFLQVFIGLVIIGLSVRNIIDRQMTRRITAERRAMQKKQQVEQETKKLETQTPPKGIV